MLHTKSKITGILHWGRKEQLRTEQSSWYDYTIYKVPVTGDIDINKIASTLRDHKFPATHNYFGGYCSLGTVKDNGDGTVNVEVIYHIGN